jgi:hypothetical protein
MHAKTIDQHSAVTAMVNAAFDAPWSLHFDRDGTEDVAVICDADGDVLASSRRFWLPEDDDLPPLTLSAMRLMAAAPIMLAALLLAQRALNAAPRFRVGDTDSYAIAAVVDKAIATARRGHAPETDEAEEA